MDRTKRDRGDAVFHSRDEIDELFAGANPNPERTGCPGEETLRLAVGRELPMEHQAYRHLAECSDCYREFRGLQEQSRRLRSRRWVSAVAAAVIVAAVGGTYAVKTAGVSTDDHGTQAIVLDYREESVTRSESGDPAHAPKTLPSKRLAATILPPIGSEAGKYEVRIVDRSGTVRFEQAARGAMEDFAIRVRVNLDLRVLARGECSLQIRRVGEDWDAHPVVIQ